VIRPKKNISKKKLLNNKKPGCALTMAAIVYSTSPSRVSSTNQNQYGSYGSVNKSILSSQSHHPSQLQHHHHATAVTMHPSASAAPLSIYQGKEQHINNHYFTMSHRNYKRKSAVEILNQTKSYYVKSETVLDHHQQLGTRGGNTLSCECFSHYYSTSF
jgi:predicted ribonuclease toxin of YeeF-YezG toxin-antitoxin module